MIRVAKPPSPERLRAGVERTAADCAAYENSRDEYVRGATRFEFDESIYGHESVRTMLHEAQHGKCCYCEGRFQAFSPADVEHYRPKGAVRQNEGSARLRPGYYWLAYSWANLYSCCPTCNRSGKKDLFPLSNPDARARSHADDVGEEAPLIVDPGRNDPRVHIEFRQEYAFGLTAKGAKTIEIIGLNRDALIELRGEHLSLLQTLLTLLRSSEAHGPQERADLESVRRLLAAAVEPAAPFSALARHFLRGTEFVPLEGR